MALPVPGSAPGTPPAPAGGQTASTPTNTAKPAVPLPATAPVPAGDGGNE